MVGVGFRPAIVVALRVDREGDVGPDFLKVVEHPFGLFGENRGIFRAVEDAEVDVLHPARIPIHPASAADDCFMEEFRQAHHDLIDAVTAHGDAGAIESILIDVGTVVDLLGEIEEIIEMIIPSVVAALREDAEEVIEWGAPFIDQPYFVFIHIHANHGVA